MSEKETSGIRRQFEAAGKKCRAIEIKGRLCLDRGRCETDPLTSFTEHFGAMQV